MRHLSGITRTAFAFATGASTRVLLSAVEQPLPATRTGGQVLWRLTVAVSCAALPGRATSDRLLELSSGKMVS